jgi:hypothetical protein
MANLLPEDVHRVVSFVPDALRKIVARDRLILAGGFIRSIVAQESITDIDLFGDTIEKLKHAATELALLYKIEKPHRSKNAITVHAVGRMPVQFITRWLFDDAANCIASFDFTIARAAIWAVPAPPPAGDFQWMGACDDLFYTDLAAKRLRYMAPARNEDAGGSMLRVLKFGHRGYTIAPASLGKVIARMAERVRWDHGLVQDETGKAKVLAGLLRQVDPLIAIDGIELADEEEPDLKEIAPALWPGYREET